MKRIGSNLRPAEQNPHRNFRNIIRYTDAEAPSNEYPKKIISPPLPKACCTAENRVLMDIVIREADRLNLLITDFLQYSRPRPPMPTQVDMGVLVAEVVKLLETSCPAGAVLRTKMAFRTENRLGQTRSPCENSFL